MQQHVSFKIAGEAGFGIKEAGVILSRTFLASGYYVFDYSEYPSLIRGGHNVYQATVSNTPLSSFYRTIDLLIALNQNTIDVDLANIDREVAVIYDSTQVKVPSGPKVIPVDVPLAQIVEKLTAPPIVKNTVAVGAAAAIARLPLESLNQSLQRSFSTKGGKILDFNLSAAKAGYEQVQNNYPGTTLELEKQQRQTDKQLFLTSNEAIALGIIASGTKTYFAYPMTPASSILHTLAKLGPRAGMVVKQPEDEIAAINNAIGASFAGVRAAVATSGGGFALMVESLGLAAITETPLVVFEVQRPGPATGVPTWTGQGDLNFVRHAAPSDFLRVVVAPGDIEESYYLTQQAFNLADKYQIPVIVLTDKLLAESRQSVPEFTVGAVPADRGEIVPNQSPDYQRYLDSPDGISSRAFPNQGEGLVFANSDEHDQAGFSTEEASTIQKMVSKRARKLKDLLKEIPAPKVYGPPEAELTLVSWGSTKLAINQALTELKDRSVNHLHFTYLSPFPTQGKELLASAKQLMLVETNSTGQLGSLIAEKTGIMIKDQLLKYNGRPFYPEEIITEIKNRLSS